jgi:D-alanine-D-alanine ligase
MGNQRLQVFPVWEMSFAKMRRHSWHIATERVKWSVEYQKKHGIDTAGRGLHDGHRSQVQHLAKRAYRALDLTGYARIDLRMDARRQAVRDRGESEPASSRRERLCRIGAARPGWITGCSSIGS